MLSVRNIDQPTRRQVRDLIRGNFATRDELYAAAKVLNDDDLAGICRRLADKLGGHAAHLQQLLMASGTEPFDPPSRDELVQHLQEMVIDMLDQRHGQRAVLGQVKAAEQKLKEEYDEAIDAVSNVEIKGVLLRQREEVAFGEALLTKMQQPQSNNGSKNGGN
jgi:uncharacterized protein (TIGR02284 family)